MLRRIDNEFNALSTQLRDKLDALKKEVGATVKYKFYIAHKNPDGEQRAAPELIYPMTYTLTPVRYTIRDPGDNAVKEIAMTNGLETVFNDIRQHNFRRIQIPERNQGLLSLDMRDQDAVERFEYLEMHPKHEGGMFRDNRIPAMFVRVDELKESKTRLRQKEMRSQALYVATKLTEDEIRNLAAAMNWNELEDFEILKDKVTTLADTDPNFFKKLLDDPRTEYKTVTKRAMDAGIISWLPAEAKFVWSTNQSVLAVLERADGIDFLDRMADWFMSHKNGTETFKKIKAILAGKQ